MSGAGFGRIGPYELRGLLGRGGMATVYRAYSPALRREVALKVLTTSESKADILRERFRREARAIARLQHPHILTFLDSGEEHGVPYLVMELIEGGVLNSRLGRPLPPQDAIAIARQIGAALDYAHSQGIIHRDVKPANIFLRGAGTPAQQIAVLADFGIAKVFGELGTKLTQTGVGIGTPEYTAPEQALGEPLDGRADLYALGIVLYAMLTGKPPYQGGTLDVVSAHVQGQLPDPRTRNPALPPAVSAVLRTALARRPQDRYGSGAALTAALEDAITGTRSLPQPRRPDASDPAQTMVLDHTREMLLETGMIPTPQLPNSEATIVAARPALPTPATPAPRHPAALPPVPTRATPPTAPPRPGGVSGGPPAQPGGARDMPLPQALPTLPPRPRAVAGGPATDDPTTPRPLLGASSGVFAPPGGTLPPLGATGAPLAPPPPPPMHAPVYAAPVYPAPLPIPAPVRPAPPPQTQRSNLPLWLALGGALAVLLLLIGFGGVYLATRDRTTPPTATVVAQAPPTIAAAPSSGGIAIPNTGGTPVPPGAATATTSAAADPARAQIATGDAALQAGTFPQAVAAYREALRVNPASASANRQLGLALWVWNHEPGEIGYLDSATKLAPDDAVAWAYLSFSAVDTHQVERAYAAAQRAVAANSNQAEAYAAIANCYVRYPPVPSDPESGKREAREAIERAKALDPNNIWVLWVEHGVLSAEENYQGALVVLDRIVAQRPNWATLYYAKGGVYHWLQRPTDARNLQEQALAIDPEYPYALGELGWLAYEDRDYPRAKDFFGRALQLTDDVNDSAHTGLGYTLAAQGDNINAILHCQRAASIETRLPGGFNCLGYLYRSTKQYTESTAAYRKVLELRPYWEDGHIGIAVIQADQGKYTEAEATLKQGLLQITKPRYAHYWLGWVLFQQQKYQEAQPNFEKAAQLVSDDAGVQYKLGQNLEQLQRYPEARAAYERTLAIDPNYQEAQQALARLQQQGR